MNDIDILTHLIDALDEASIFADAEFEKLRNEHKFESAEMFCLLRDTLRAQSSCIKDFRDYDHAKELLM